MRGSLVTIVVGALVAGCAVGVRDPQPEPTPTPEQQEAPLETFAGDLEEELDSTLPPGVAAVPPRQRQPISGRTD
jgi:hypothetical protein